MLLLNEECLEACNALHVVVVKSEVNFKAETGPTLDAQRGVNIEATQVSLSL